MSPEEKEDLKVWLITQVSKSRRTIKESKHLYVGKLIRAIEQHRINLCKIALRRL